MKRNTVIILFVFSLLVVGVVGLLMNGDHRTDRNIPGATTGAGKADRRAAPATLELACLVNVRGVHQFTDELPQGLMFWAIVLLEEEGT